MMFLKAFCIFDTKTGLYSVPFFLAHKGLAVRTAVEMTADPNSQLSRYPHDFRLVLVGEFDDTIGRLSSCEAEDFGSLASIVAGVRNETHPDLSRATAAEVIAVREEERSVA